MYLKNKRGDSSIGTALKVLISVVLGGLVLLGTMQVINGTVAPKMASAFGQQNSDEVVSSGGGGGASSEAAYVKKTPFGDFSENAYAPLTAEGWARSVYHDTSGMYGDFLLTLGGNKSLDVIDGSTYDLGNHFAFDFLVLYQNSYVSDYVGSVTVGGLTLDFIKRNDDIQSLSAYVSYEETNVLSFGLGGDRLTGEKMSDAEKRQIATAAGGLNKSNMPTRKIPVHVEYNEGNLSVSLTLEGNREKTYRATLNGCDFTGSIVRLHTGNVSGKYQSAAIGKFSGVKYGNS